ncbi:MAG: hypothetical protein AAB581_02085 [Patescibacteria group bacterium]
MMKAKIESKTATAANISHCQLLEFAFSSETLAVLLAAPVIVGGAGGSVVPLGIGGTELEEKFAVTVLMLFTETAHCLLSLPITESHPLQPEKTCPDAGVAVSVTETPDGYSGDMELHPGSQERTGEGAVTVTVP